MYIPQKMFLTKGVGKHKEKLTSFEMALRNAKIAAYNLVSVSSIFPPRCKMVSVQNGLQELTPGQIIHVVLSKNSTNEPNRLIAASIGVAIPADSHAYGYLSEHHSYGERETKAGEYAEDLAAEMLATVLGVDFDPDSSWYAKKDLWKTQSAIGNKNGLWTTVLAAAILLP
jgi:arginine decarboxylase